VWLSPRDRERYEGVEQEVIDELCAYLLEHARREDLIMASSPHIAFHTDERLSLGEFGIQARLVRHEPDRGHEQHPEHVEAEPAEHGETLIYSASAPAAAADHAAPAPARGRPQRALLALGARRLLVPPGGGTLGRSRDCDLVLDDVGISRKHAQIRPGPNGWTVEDLGSTNGLRVNGEEVSGVRALRPGDHVELGSTEIVFEVS
jgi:FHA domain/FhaA, N-terminal domain